MIDLWGKGSGPFLQALHFLVMIGATICPQLAKLFLASYNEYETNTLQLTNDTELEDIHNLKEDSLTNILNDTKPQAEGDLFAEFETKIHYVYLLISTFALIGGIMQIINLCCSGCDLQHIHITIKDENNSTDSKKTTMVASLHKEQRCYSFTVLALLCLIVVFFAGLEEIFGAFLVTFSVGHLKWETSTSRDLVSVFWGSAATARLISIFVSYCIKPKVLLGFCTFSATVVTIAMAFTANMTILSIWIGTILVGLSTGSLVATIISMGKSFLNFSGFLSSVVFVSIFVGKIATPPFMGYILQEIGFMWFLYGSVIYASLMFSHYVILLFISLQCKSPFSLRRRCDEKSSDIVS